MNGWSSQEIPSLIIQMLSPAVMISACGLLMLGLGNKYARVVDRIRHFAAELRDLKRLGTSAGSPDQERIQSLELQFPDLYRRGRFLRNAVWLLQLAVLLFVACSFSIAIRVVWVPVALFCFGMTSVLIGTFLAMRETLLSYRLIRHDLPGDTHSLSR